MNEKKNPKSLTKRTQQLPTVIEELQKYIIIGAEKLKTYQSALKAIDKVGLSKEIRDKVLREAQMLGENLLLAEKRMGQLLGDIDKSDSRLRGSTRGTTVKSSLPEGINKKQSHIAQQIKNYWEIVETFIKLVEKGEDIPTRQGAIKAIKLERKGIEKELKRQAAIEKGQQIKDETVFVRSIEKLSLEKESVDLIITDPPYADKDVKTYEALAQVANECLKPGSFCCCYAGKLRLPDVLNAVTKHLEYVWCIAVFHPFSKEKHLGSPYQFAENWRPVLVFKKEGKPKTCNFQQDVVRAKRDKDFHDWQQDLQTPSQLIEAYTEPEDLVVDPFCGGGTTLVAAKRSGRRWLGFDASEESVALSKERLYGTD
jgi:site-specific DNA-methyltransferase (adenine-specific)